MTAQNPNAQSTDQSDAPEPGELPPALAAATPLEDYALLSDLSTGPLVSRDGSVDWLCLPRFDSPAMFTALLGDPDDGRWKLWAVDGTVTDRRYVPRTFILETTWQTPTGTVRVTDFLPPADDQDDLVRRVECLDGEVVIEHDLRLRFDYARSMPWFRRLDAQEAPGGRPALLCVAGPDGVLISGPLLEATTEPTEDDGDAVQDAVQELTGADAGTGAPGVSGVIAPRLAGRYRLSAGERRDWTLTWFPSWDAPHQPVDPDRAQAETQRFWTEWADNVEVNSPEGHLVLRSLMVLRALTNGRTGGIVAAPTASLPEDFGGSRNWDYRYTWLRDAALTIEVLASHGFTDGATEWRNWLLRAVAGDPEQLKIMYGLGGERELDEKELDHLSGYAGSRPVRIGNGAADQYQADVVGEVMLALAALRDAGQQEDEFSWGLQRSLLHFCIVNIDRKDHGLWEMRGKLHHFTHGRVMMWAAFNEGIRAVAEHGLEGDVEQWTHYRDRLHAEIMEHGFDEELDSFVQTYGATEVDASLLQLPHTGFIAVDDPKMLGTVARIERDLVDGNGLVYRYRIAAGLDGLEGDEYPFMMCAFWLVEQYAASGRLQEAEERMGHLCSLATDLGLLAEEYDPSTQRLAGNFPQAFSHLALIRAADAIQRAKGSAV